MRQNEAQVWYVNCDVGADGVCRALTLIDPLERERADRMLHPDDRNRAIVSWAARRRILAAYLGITAAEVALSYSANGKPSLSPSMNSPLVFSTSRVNSQAMIGVCVGGSIGVDIEACVEKPGHDHVATETFSECELRDWTAMTGSRKRDAFYRCWTRKEAAFKALDVEASFAFRSIDVGIDRASRVVLAGDGPSIDVRTIAAPSGHMAALASDHRFAGIVTSAWREEHPDSRFTADQAQHTQST